MYINKIISDSSKYHQENKIGIVLEGIVRRLGRCRFGWSVGKGLAEGVKLELRLQWIKEGGVFQAEGIACANILRQRFTLIFKKPIAVNKEVNGSCSVAESCLTLCDPLDCTLPGSSVHGIFQARVLE